MKINNNQNNISIIDRDLIISKYLKEICIKVLERHKFEVLMYPAIEEATIKTRHKSICEEIKFLNELPTLNNFASFKESERLIKDRIEKLHEEATELEMLK